MSLLLGHIFLVITQLVALEAIFVGWEASLGSDAHLKLTVRIAWKINGYRLTDPANAGLIYREDHRTGLDVTLVYLNSHKINLGSPFQYQISRLIVKSRSRDIGNSNCRIALYFDSTAVEVPVIFPERSNNSKYKSRGLEAEITYNTDLYQRSVLTIRRLIGYWNRALFLDPWVQGSLGGLCLNPGYL